MTERALAVIPLTGEVIPVDAPTGDIAAALQHIANLERDLREARDLLRAALCDRADLDNTRTLREDEWEVVVGKPDLTEWDPEALEPVLERLVAEGKTTAEAARKALEPVRVLKPRTRELDKLLGSPRLDDGDREALAACRRPTGRARPVRVARLDETRRAAA